MGKGRDDRPEPDPRIGEIASLWRDRWEQFYAPIEENYVKRVSTFASPENQAAAAATARADTVKAAADARAAATREATAFGIRPDSGRFAGIQRAGELGSALAVVDAENTARKQVRDTGMALEREAVGMGQQQLGASADTLLSQFSAERAAYNDTEDQRNRNALGWGKAIGTGLGLIISSKDQKKDKEPIVEGKALDAIRGMPVEEWAYKGDSEGRRHYGPYAEDFERETGMGDGKTIPAQDMLGLTVKAVQDLDRKVESLADNGGRRGLPGPEAAGDASGAAPAPRRRDERLEEVDDTESMFGILPRESRFSRRAA